MHTGNLSKGVLEPCGVRVDNVFNKLNIGFLEILGLLTFKPSQRKLKSKKRKEENEGLEKGDSVIQQKQKKPHTRRRNSEKQGNRGKEEETSNAKNLNNPSQLSSSEIEK